MRKVMERPQPKPKTVAERLHDDWLDELATQGYPPFWREAMAVTAETQREMMQCLHWFVRGALMAETFRMRPFEEKPYEFSDQIHEFEGRAFNRLKYLRISPDGRERNR